MKIIGRWVIYTLIDILIVLSVSYFVGSGWFVQVINWLTGLI